MRHLNINLRNGEYTDPALLDLRKAFENLPAFAEVGGTLPAAKPQSSIAQVGISWHMLATPKKVSGRRVGSAERLETGSNGNKNPC